MPGTDLMLDPLTHDFVDDGKGDWKEDSTIASQIQHQLLDHKGLWFADPDAGCEAFAIERKGDRGTALRFEDAYRDALRVFLESGLAEDLQLQVASEKIGQFIWKASLVDVQHGELDISPLLSFGVGEK